MAITTFEFGCITGEGSTKREAREDALRKAEAALNGDYRPIVVSFREIVCVVVRTPTSWTTYSGGQGYTVWRHLLSRREIEASTHAHVAQLAWDGAEDESPLLADWPEEQKEFRRWARRQKAVRHYRGLLMARGVDRNEAEWIAVDIVDGWEKAEAHGLEPLAA